MKVRFLPCAGMESWKGGKVERWKDGKLGSAGKEKKWKRDINVKEFKKRALKGIR